MIEDGDRVTLGGMTLRGILDGGPYAGRDDVDDHGSGRRQHLLRRVPWRRDSKRRSSALNNPRHPTVVADTQRTLRRLKDLEAPDLFLHNHPQNLGRALNRALPVNSRCVFCLDADAWREMVKRAEASFQTMLREAKEAKGR